MRNMPAAWWYFEFLYFIQGQERCNGVTEFMDEYAPPVHCPEQSRVFEWDVAEMAADDVYCDWLDYEDGEDNEEKGERDSEEIN